MIDPSHPDVLVAGGGASALAAGIGLARAGCSVTIAGPTAAPRNARTVALFDGSIAFLERLGVWEALRPHATPIAGIRMIDATGSLFAAAPLDLAAKDIRLDALGQNIENADLVAGLARAAAAHPAIALTDALVTRIETGPQGVAQLSDGSTISAPLLVAADGRRSLARAAAGIETREWSYPQTAITALLAHDGAHHGFSTEFHTRAGPLTFVPMAPSAREPNRSSLVWLMAPADAERRVAMSDTVLAQLIGRAARGAFGTIRMEGPRAAFPMSGMIARSFTAPGLALIGEAAHVFPPIGAQGLNLGLRDVADLVDAVAAAGIAPPDAALAAYERRRRGDVALRTAGIDLLNRSLLIDTAPADALRGAAFRAVAGLAPLRRSIMREGVRQRAAS